MLMHGLLLQRSFTMAVVTGAFALTPLRGQTIAPVAVVNHYASPQSIPVRIEPDPPRIGAAPFVVLGGLIGAGAVTTYWVHAFQASARENGNDGFFIPPIVFVSVGAGAVGGGLLGWVIHDAVTHP